MNRWNGIGRLTSKPELKQGNNVAVASGTVAVNRRFKKSTRRI